MQGSCIRNSCPQLFGMNTSPANANMNLVVLAQMLERLDRSAHAVDAEQYRAVAARLAAELQAVPRDAALEGVLESFPAAAQLYENLNYQHAGLCRSPMDASLAAELAARAAIDGARRSAPGQPAQAA
jgi:hypothetical protein